MRRSWLIASALLIVLSILAAASSSRSSEGWATDPGWHQGKAEWALYDAVRPIYGTPRRYEATVFTNTQHMDPTTTAKASDHRAPNAIAVFKQNVSEMIPTEHYTYRFLTTSFLQRSDLGLYKLVMSSQEDCGASYKQFVRDGRSIEARQFVYFPGAGESDARIAPGKDLMFHDALGLVLRGFPIGETMDIRLVPDQTDTRETGLTPGDAEIRSMGPETVTVPYGEVRTHHIRVTHDEMGGSTTSEFWMATDASMRGVMVRYRGPFGVEYELKRLAWWAYWAEPRPE